MANRYMKQFLFSFNPMLTYIEGNAVIGGSGAVGTTKGSGISSVVRLSQGRYQINLEDPYARYLGGYAGCVAPTTGSNVAAASLAAGTVYVITAVGTTNWQTAGLAAGITPAVGMAFKATAASTGTGTAKAVGTSGIAMVEVVGDANLTVAAPTPYLIIQTMGPTAAGDTTLIPQDPASGSVLGFALMLRNSSLKGKGE